MNANGKKMGKRWENMGKDGGVSVCVGVGVGVSGGVSVSGGICECS